MLIAEGTRSGVFEAKEREMLEAVLRLADRRVPAIMTPRSEVLGLDENADAADIAARLEKPRLSRYPVCRGTLDQPVGIIQTQGHRLFHDHVFAGAREDRSMGRVHSAGSAHHADAHFWIARGRFQIGRHATPIHLLGELRGPLPDRIENRDEAQRFDRLDHTDVLVRDLAAAQEGDADRRLSHGSPLSPRPPRKSGHGTLAVYRSRRPEASGASSEAVPRKSDRNREI